MKPPTPRSVPTEGVTAAPDRRYVPSMTTPHRGAGPAALALDALLRDAITGALAEARAIAERPDTDPPRVVLAVSGGAAWLSPTGEVPTSPARWHAASTPAEAATPAGAAVGAGA